ncbi:hypothetical protein JST97_27645, partial [bacterium]|nr:hypothetical protein [bacterium]
VLSSLVGDMGMEAPPAPPPPPSPPSSAPAAEDDGLDELEALFISEEPAAPPPPVPVIPEPEPEPEPVREPEPAPAAVVPTPATPTPAPAADDGDDLSDFLRGLGYTEDDGSAVEPPVAESPSQAAPTPPMEPEPMEMEPMEVEAAEPEPPAPEPEPAPAEAEPAAESTSIEDLLGLSDANEAVAVPPPQPAAEESVSIEDLLGISDSQPEPEAEPTRVEAQVEDNSIEALLGLSGNEEPAPAPAPEPTPEPASFDANAILQAAVVAQVMGQLDEAEAKFKEILNAEPSHYPTLQQYGVFARSARGDAARSLELLNQARQLAEAAGDEVRLKQIDQELGLLKSSEQPAVTEAPKPNESRAFADLDDVLENIIDFIDLGKLDKAKPKLEKLLTSNPGHPQVLNLLAKVASEGDDWAGAAQWLEQEIESRPGDEAFDQLANAYEKLDQQDQLKSTYQRWLAFNPQAERPQSAAPPAEPAYKEFEARGEWAEALAALTEAESGERERLFQAWRDGLEQTNQYEQALQVVDRQAQELSLDLNEERQRLYGAWAQQEESGSNWEAATRVYQAQLGQDLNPAGAVQNLERIYTSWSQEPLSQGDFEQAIQIWDKAKDLSQLQSLANERIGALYLEWGQALRAGHDYSSAVTVLEQGRVVADTDAARAEIGQTFQDWSAHWEREGDFEQAIDCLKRQAAAVGASDTLNQQMIGLYKTWAQFLEEDGQKEAAQEVYSRLQADFPDAEIPSSDPWPGHQTQIQELKGAQDYAAALAIVDGFLNEHSDHAEAQQMRSELREAQFKAWRESGDWESWIAALKDGDSEEAKAGFAQHGQSLSQAEALAWAEKWTAWDEAGAQAYRDQAGRAWVGELKGAEALAKAEELGLADLQPGILQAWTDSELSAKDYEGALGRLPASQHARVLEAWSQSLEEEGDYEESINILNRWLATDGEAEIPQQKLVSAYKSWAEGLAEDHPEAAVAVLEQLLAASFPLIQQEEKRAEIQTLLNSWKPAEPVAEAPAEETAAAEAAPVEEVAAEEPAAEATAIEEAPVAAVEDSPAAEQANEETPAAPVTSAGSWSDLVDKQSAGDWEGALGEGAALQAASPDPDAYAGLLVAHAIHLMDEKQPAAQILEQAKGLDGLSDESKDKIEKALLRVKIEEALLGDDDRAEDLLREMMSQDPSNDTYHNALYRLHSGSSMSGRRLVDFYRDLQKSYPNEPSFLLQLARAYCNASKDTLAVVQFRKLVQISPQASYYVELAQTYVRLGKGGDAQKAISSALELDGELSAGLLTEIQVLILSKDLEGAKAKAETAKEKLTGLDTVQNWLNNVLAALNEGKAPDEATLSQMPNLLTT